MASELAKINDDEPDERSPGQKKRDNDLRKAALCGRDLKTALSYNPDTGLFERLITGRGYGHRLGFVNAHGYNGIQVNGVKFLCHRLAWFFVHGEWPLGEIDHIDGNRTNNKINNLRIATRQQNTQNCASHRDKTDLGKGAYLKKDCPRPRPWKSQIYVNGRTIHLGYFLSKEEAVTAYQNAAKKHFGEFARLQ